MPAIRKRLFLGLFTLVALIALVLALALGAASSRPPGTLTVVYVTTNAAGMPMALLEVTLYKAAWVRYESIDIRAENQWRRARWVPTNVLTRVNGLCTVRFRRGYGPAHKATWIEFPTNANWKLGLEVVEPRTGIGGTLDRIFHGRSYYRAGGWSNVVYGTRPVPYVGRSWRIESEEIQLPRH